MNSADSIFHHAREFTDPAECSAYLDVACSGDGEIRSKVEALLSADKAAKAFFNEVEAQEYAPPRQPLLVETNLQIPEQIGPYRILERLGLGGMGEVFRAEQRQPFRREVALKLIKLGMDTKQVVARFEAERQAMALMDHPHIAKVYGADADEKGRPYFAMEYVKGIPITEYADINHLTVKERLELFQQVCHAIQHAHQKGVIHRDIKPSNILVSTQDGSPHAKVIDFGIAKATALQLTDKTLFTLHDQFIGTPQYMSPEQATGSLDIDTRSDVYSLGVLLYELLTGHTPFDTAKLKQVALHEIARILRDEEPPKPSTRLGTLASLSIGKPSSPDQTSSHSSLATLAKARSMDAQQLIKEVRGELDWLVMKAMEKDRIRRYDSPGSMAEDIGRYLDGSPIEAAPPTFRYRAGKFIRRNKLPVTAAVVLSSILLGSIVLISGLAVRLTEQVKLAVAAKSISENARIEAERERNLALEANLRADVEAKNAGAAKSAAEQSLALQELTTARLLIRTGEIPTARDLIKRSSGADAFSSARRWVAWEYFRASREFARTDLRSKMPAGFSALSSRTTGLGRAHFDFEKRQLTIIYERIHVSADPSASSANSDPTATASSTVKQSDATFDLHEFSPVVGAEYSEPPRLQTGDEILEVAAKRKPKAKADTSSPGGKPLPPTLLSVSCLVSSAPKTLEIEYPAGIDEVVVDSPTGRVAVFLVSGRLVALQLSEGKLVELASIETGSEPSNLTTVAIDPKYNVIHFVSGDWCYASYVIGKNPDTIVTSESSGHTGTARRTACSADGTLVASIGYDHHIKIWDQKTMKLKTDLPLKNYGGYDGFNQLVGNLSFLPGGQSLVFSTVYGPAWMLNLDNLKDVTQIPFPRNPGLIATGKSGNKVFAAQRDTGDRQICSYDLRSKQVVELPYEQTQGSVYAMQVSPDETKLAWVTAHLESDRQDLDSVYSYDVRTNEVRCVATGFGPLRDLDFSPDGSLLAVSSRDGTATIMTWPEGKILHRLVVRQGISHTNIVSSVRFHPSLPILVTASHDNRLVFWDVKGGYELATLNLEFSRQLNYFIGFLKEADFTPDGKRLLVCTGDDSSGQVSSVDLTFWDTPMKDLLRQETPTEGKK